jgi:toxin ParE1/3/4
MATFKLSRRAEADLLNIGAYTLDRWGDDQAVRYLAELEACCQRLADLPLLGRACNHIRPGLRCMEQGSHIVFYRPAAEFVFISRILHQSMLPARHSMDEKS